METLVINIDVPDLASGVKFYSAGLGFHWVRDLFDGSVAEMKHKSGTVFLLARPSGSAPVATLPIQRDYAPHWTPVHFDLPVNDLAKSVEVALAAGATLSGEITSQVYGVLAPMRDPFGHGFCLIEFTAMGYDAAAS